MRAASAVCLAVGFLLLVPALFVAAAAATSVLLGTVLVVGLLGFTTFSVNVVASQRPGASLLVALLTYGLVVMLLAAVFAGLHDASSIDTTWLGGTIIVLVLTWTFVQVLASVRARQPLYDLPATPDRLVSR
ncbi:MAG: hypothetical protein QM655_16130 [Nocardioidaceae bacterium]